MAVGGLPTSGVDTRGGLSHQGHQITGQGEYDLHVGIGKFIFILSLSSLPEKSVRVIHLDLSLCLSGHVTQKYCFDRL